MIELFNSQESKFSESETLLVIYDDCVKTLRR